MKRLWIGVALMVLLLTGSIWEFRRLENTYRPASEQMAQAVQMAQQKNLDGAAALTRAVESAWDEHKHLTAAFAVHDSMDEIESLFAELRSYYAAGDEAGYAVICAQLSTLLDTLANSHSLTWWNFF